MLKAMLKKKKRGFTLIELIVVIAILGILAAVLLPRFLGFSDDAKKATVQADAKNIATAIEAIIANNHEFEAGTGVTGKYGPDDVMKYVGKNLNGVLTLHTVSSGGIAGIDYFTYEKAFNNANYKITYYLVTTTTGGTPSVTYNAFSFGPIETLTASSITATTMATGNP